MAISKQLAKITALLFGVACLLWQAGPAFCQVVIKSEPAIISKAVSISKPVIGINLDVSGEKHKRYAISARYVDAITKSGGIALLLPPMNPAELAQIIPNLDGILMIGGDDYPPQSYGQEPGSKTTVMHPERSDFDLLVVRSVLAQAKMPYLGICAGEQALNIASGGELTQDIPTLNPSSKVIHGGKKGGGDHPNMHMVTFKKGSKLASLLGESPLMVPTSHHQCVSKLGKNLSVAATTDDGLTEAVEGAEDRFLIGVQWHPERDYDHNQPIFAELIKQATLYRAAKALIAPQ